MNMLGVSEAIYPMLSDYPRTPMQYENTEVPSPSLSSPSSSFFSPCSSSSSPSSSSFGQKRTSKKGYYDVIVKAFSLFQKYYSF